MSSRKALPLNLSPRARQDFVDILRYSGETWGQAQLLTYRDKINDALHAIGQSPQLGHPRADLPQTHLAYLVGSHVIVYRIDADSLGGRAHPAPAHELPTASIAAGTASNNRQRNPLDDRSSPSRNAADVVALTNRH